jgi:hypothetical protein
MSDFIAIAVARGKVLHLIDWDRPCWLRADDPRGDRLIPDVDSMLTDALLFFSYSDFDMPRDIFAGQRGNNQVFEMKDGKGYVEVQEARKVLRSRKEPFVLLAHFGKLDQHLQSDIELFTTPIITSEISLSKARALGVG